MTDDARQSLRKAERASLISRARTLRAGIQQIFTDAESWNDNARRPDEEPVDPDPFGEMRRLLAAIDEMLANDPGHGPIAPIKFTRSHEWQCVCF